MALIRSRRCACGTEYDVLEQRGIVVGIDRADDQPVCPKCEGTTFVSIVKAGRGIDLPTNYPYFDQGLGCEVRSSAHRKQLCKERGLIPLDGADPGMERRTDADREDDDLEAGYNDYVRRLDEAPEFREYREMRDKGALEAAWTRR